MPAAVTGHPAHRYPLSGSPARGFAGGAAGFFVGFAAVALYGPAAELFQDRMQLSATALGFLVAAPQIAGALLRIPCGVWADRAGGRVPMLTLLGLSLIGMWGLAFVLAAAGSIGFNLYPVLVFFGLLCGSGIASFSAGLPQVSYWYPRNRQAVILGAYGGIGNLAPGMFTLALPLAIGRWGLAGSYFAWFFFLIAGAGVYALLARDACYFPLRTTGLGSGESRTIAAQCGQELFPVESAWHALIVAAENPRTLGLMLLYFVSFGGFLALSAWFPVFWANSYRVGAVEAGILSGAGFSLVAAAIRIYGGALSDRIGAERTAFVAYFVVLAGALLVTFGPGFSLSLAGELLMALGMGTGNAAVFALVPKYVPQAVPGAAAFVGGIGATGGFILRLFLGAVADALGRRRGYAGGFLPSSYWRRSRWPSAGIFIALA
ncbi:MAG: MFS transporter [Gammaproteobacteria bacterium]|nr:MFS transporter [Gammaproteobacteria bacterium]